MVPDNWNFNGSNPCLYHGGNYNQNQNHGPFYVNYNRTSNSNDNIGCRILAKPQANPPFGSRGSSPFLYHTVDRTALAEEKPTGHSLVLVSVDQTLDECSELLHIFIHIIFDLNDLFVQAVIAVSPMAGVHFLNCQTKVFVRYDLFVNSNSFHQGCFSSL